jgi:hypothetical protein
MNRRQAITATASAVAAALLRPGALGALSAQSPGAMAVPPEGETLYLSPLGVDANPGTRERPLLTLAAAATRVNESKGSGAMTIVLSEGVYAVGEQATFKPQNRTFTRSGRLTIRAEVLPDDPEWHSGRMPTLIHTLPLKNHWNGRPLPPGSGGTSYGVQIETSHATLRGLKVLGAPVVETPRPRMLNRIYPIGRFGRTLDDLEIAQCLLAGDKVTNPNHLPIIANGNGLNIHHCVFYNTKLTAVYWTGGSTGHAMRNCLLYGAYAGGVWTSEIAPDFDFRNNIIANSHYAWIYQSAAGAAADPDAGGGRRGAPPVSTPAQPRERVRYKAIDSLFTNNKAMAATGTGANLGFKDIDASFIELVNSKVSPEPLTLEMDESKRGYLHPLAGTDAARIGAGLFMKSIG